MSGYCQDCGNTQCICKEVERQENEPSSCTVDSIVGQCPHPAWRLVHFCKDVYTLECVNCVATIYVRAMPNDKLTHGVPTK